MGSTLRYDDFDILGIIKFKPEEVDDDGIVILAKQIARKIEGELDYPGQIKVNIIRETRSVDYAT